MATRKAKTETGGDTGQGTPSPIPPPLTIEQLRVAVAQDALRLLRIEWIEPTKGTYFYSPYSPDLRGLGSKELQRRLLDSVPECRVCALGLSAISLVRVKDSISGRDLVWGPDGVARGELGDEWASIVEDAFENWNVADKDGCERLCVLRVDLEIRERAQLIMQAVIETEGDEDRLRDRLFAPTGAANV